MSDTRRVQIVLVSADDNAASELIGIVKRELVERGRGALVEKYDGAHRISFDLADGKTPDDVRKTLDGEWLRVIDRTEVANQYGDRPVIAAFSVRL